MSLIKIAQRPIPRQYELVDRARAYDPDFDESALNRAYVFAVEKHGARRRASGDLYYSHPIAVAVILTDIEADGVTVVAGLLHDTVELESVTTADIQETFGSEAAFIVDGLTPVHGVKFKDNKAQKEADRRKLIIAMEQDPRILLVKLADRLHNMRTLRYRPIPEGRQATALETLEFYAPLASYLGLTEIREELVAWSTRELWPGPKTGKVRDFLREKGVTNRAPAILEEVLGNAATEKLIKKLKALRLPIRMKIAERRQKMWRPREEVPHVT